jgi:hypothetical protein
MTSAEFNSQIIRLKEVYGAPKYTGERMALLWRELQELPLEFFKTAVDALIMSKANAPMPSDFMEVLRRPLNDLAEAKKQAALKGLPGCYVCDSSGVLFSTDVDKGHRYAFQCTCPRGAILYPGFPRMVSTINPRSPNLSAEDVEAVEKFKAFLNDPRATIFRRA